MQVFPMQVLHVERLFRTSLLRWILKYFQTIEGVVKSFH